MIYRKTEGAVLWSQNERNLDCTLTFQTHSILQRFLVRFDALQLDCNDHLYVYDGAHATGNAKVYSSDLFTVSILISELCLQMDISCRNTKQSVGNIITQSNFLTLKYVTDGWGTDSNGFKMVVTAIKNISKSFKSHKSHSYKWHFNTYSIADHSCKEFRCKSSEFCISADLVCDSINHCADGTDESPYSLCPSKCIMIKKRANSFPNHLSSLSDVESKTILGLEMTWLVLFAVSAFLVLSACFVGISIWFCRLRTSSQDLQC